MRAEDPIGGRGAADTSFSMGALADAVPEGANGSGKVGGGKAGASSGGADATSLIVVPVGMIVAYGLVRVLSSAFGELRE